jgi:uncharacterized membrane protein YedE/YeeE
MRTVSALAAGLVFGIGIAISGMADPAKVLNFFDITGTFDPSLIFVMISAMLTAMIGYRFVLARQKPLYDEAFHLPPSKVVDAPLVLGAVTFGIGWGISGFCPGGAIPALGLGYAEPLIFVASMEVGMVATYYLRQYQARQRLAA